MPTSILRVNLLSLPTTLLPAGPATRKINPASPRQLRRIGSLLSTVAIPCWIALLLLPTSFVRAAPNLLPNASFELGFGEQSPTHWHDYQNQFTINLTATEQIPPGHASVEQHPDVPDGTHFVRLPVTPADPAHLPSPMIQVRSAQAYTLSVYARSDEPSARIQLTMWTRSMDLQEPPDAASLKFSLGKQWRRYDFSFVTEEFMEQAVVDLIASADVNCDVQVDAVQLETGGLTSKFRTRYPIEGVLSGRRQRTGLHFMNEPVVVYTTLYNQTQEDQSASLELRFEDMFSGRHLLTRTLSGPFLPGLHEHTVTIDPAPLGRFRARLFSSDGEMVGADDYAFIVHPVMDDDFQGVMYSQNGKAGMVPAERVILPWQNDRNWYADPPQNLVITKDGVIDVPMADGVHLARTTDGGRSWDMLDVPVGDEEYVDLGYAGVGFFRDGTFLRAFWNKEASHVQLRASTDQGNTWSDLGVVKNINGPPQFAPLVERTENELVWAIHHPVEGQPNATYAYHSSDRGRTWSRPYPIAPGGEPTISQMHSGRLIALVRHNPHLPHLSYADKLPFENYTAWRFWQRLRKGTNITSWTKRVLLARSDDHGFTWHTIGPGSLMLDEMHGGTLELPDGRLMLHHTHRGPPLRGGEWVRLSDDGGESFEDRIYYLTSTPAYPGYASMCVLPPHLADGKPGMVLSVVGERGRPNHPARMQAIRWRPLGVSSK